MADGVFDDDGDYNNNNDSNETSNSINKLEKEFWKDNAHSKPSLRCVDVSNCGAAGGWLWLFGWLI